MVRTGRDSGLQLMGHPPAAPGASAHVMPRPSEQRAPQLHALRVEIPARRPGSPASPAARPPCRRDQPPCPALPLLHRTAPQPAQKARLSIILTRSESDNRRFKRAC